MVPHTGPSCSVGERFGFLDGSNYAEYKLEYHRTYQQRGLNSRSNNLI